MLLAATDRQFFIQTVQRDSPVRLAFGTGLLILAGSKSQFVSKILSVPPLTQIGDVSYGWYIWHWPLIVFADIIYPASTTAKVFSALIALIASIVSYRLVEHPIRINPRLIGRRALRLAAVCVIVPPPPPHSPVCCI